MTAAPDDFCYPRAPIIEAVIELRFPEVSQQKVNKVADILRPRYENREEEQLTEGALDFAARNATFKDVSKKFKLSSADQADSFIITVSNVVWSRLAPYEGWPSFFGRFDDQISKVLKALGAPRLTRIGLRYVNRIDIPFRGDAIQPEEYVMFHIQTGDILRPASSFLWATQKHFADRGLSATVQSAAVPSELAGHGGVTLDIDIFLEVDVPWQSDHIRSRLGEMRQLKNEIFEAGITDKARELFNVPKP